MRVVVCDTGPVLHLSEARALATLLGMEVHGSLGVVLWAAAQAHISRHEAAAILDRLAGSSLWISPALLAEARRALDVLS